MHDVQVEDTVYACVKEHAIPLEDDFNSALKRLLTLAIARQGDETKSASPGLDIPEGTPMGFECKALEEPGMKLPTMWQSCME
jgi:hypothetical protein